MHTTTPKHRPIILASMTLLTVGAGAVLCAWLVATKPVPQARGVLGRAPVVTVVPVVAVVTESPIVAYGTVRPKHQIKIVPQVSGKLVFAHQDLAVGKIIPEGALLFEIDATVYEARVSQVEAEVRQLEATLERTGQEKINLDERIANTERMLAIDEEDHKTSKRLFERDQVGTQRDVNLAYQKYLHQNDAMIELRARRSVIPHRRMETAAQLDAARARLARARHDLKGTKIFCPFAARVESVSAHESQVVTAPFSIATLTDMSAFEIAVGIDPRELRWLHDDIRPDALERGVSEDAPAVDVSWTLQGQQYDWKGRVTRFEKVDEETRTARLVVEVRNRDMRASSTEGQGAGPRTLSLGMYCRTELPSERLDGALLVPRHAIYESRWVYIFEADAAPDAGHLRRRRVPLLRSVGDAVLVDYSGRQGTQPCELSSGAMLVVSPLIKPVDGMVVRARTEHVVGIKPFPTHNRAPAVVAQTLAVGSPRLGHAAPRTGGG